MANCPCSSRVKVDGNSSIFIPLHNSCSFLSKTTASPGFSVFSFVKCFELKLKSLPNAGDGVVRANVKYRSRIPALTFLPKAAR